MNIHDEVLLTGFTYIAETILVVGAFSMAIAIDYLYFKSKR